jgi:type I restriction enzyme, S subunit
MSESIPAGWEMQDLGEVSFVTKLAGFEYTEHFDYSIGGEVIALRVLNLKKGKLDLSNIQTIPRKTSELLPRSKLSYGDLALSYVGTVGEVGFINQDNKYHLAPNVAKISPNTDRVEPQFLLQQFLSSPVQKWIKHLGAVTSQPSLSMGNLRKVKLSLPPLPEQQKIASILTSVDTVIEKTEAQINKLKDLKKAMMQELLTKGIGHTEFKDSSVGRIPVGWEVGTIESIANVIRGASPRPKGDPRYYGGDVPRLMVADVTRDGKYVTPKIDFLTKEGATLSRPMPAGTLTIVCSGTVGIPSILKVDCCIHDGFIALENILPKVEKEFLYYVFLNLKEVLDSSATHGGVFTNLTTQIIKDFEITIPKIDEQIKISNLLTDIDIAIQTKETKLSHTKSLKKALMQDLLTGKVRVAV